MLRRTYACMGRVPIIRILNICWGLDWGTLFRKLPFSHHCFPGSLVDEAADDGDEEGAAALNVSAGRCDGDQACEKHWGSGLGAKGLD